MGILDMLKRDCKSRRFKAWQIEITTRCSLHCAMCIKTACKEWKRKDMSVDDFKKIFPYLHDVESVVLEGWGESLLHENLVDFIRLAKSAGPEVGFVTSGTGLNAEYARQVVDAGVDFMGFSLSGATAETHNAIRVNSDFDTLITSMQTVKTLSLKNPWKKPRLHIVYLMLKENIHEIPILLDLALTMGINEIILLNIIQVTSRGQDSLKTFTCQDGFLYPNILKTAEDKANKLKIKLSLPASTPQDVAVCSENPLENVYISADGEVSPCVFLQPPVTAPFTRIFCNTEYPTFPVSFGNVFRQSFETIWESDGYRKFRGAFVARQKRWKQAYESLLQLRPADPSPLPEPPSPCRTCHKMLGF